MKAAVRINPRGRVVKVKDFLLVIQRLNWAAVVPVASSRARIAAATLGLLFSRSIDSLTIL
jgi:hypothetical protein